MTADFAMISRMSADFVLGTPVSHVLSFVRSIVTVNGVEKNGSGPIRVNNDSVSLKRSQFHPRVAVDANSGKVAVSWYDCRLSGSNDSVHFSAAVSKDSFATAPVNFPLNPSPSTADWFCDYTGLYYYNGVIYPAWPDRSNNPGTNPDGTTKHDCYIAKIAY
jgi:hypothetical protein